MKQDNAIIEVEKKKKMKVYLYSDGTMAKTFTEDNAFKSMSWIPAKVTCDCTYCGKTFTREVFKIDEYNDNSAITIDYNPENEFNDDSSSKLVSLQIDDVCDECYETGDGEMEHWLDISSDDAQEKYEINISVEVKTKKKV